MNYNIAEALSTFVVSVAAQEHFRNLIAKEQAAGSASGTAIRIAVTHPGTAKAGVEVSICPSGWEESSDLPLSFDNLLIYIALDSIRALEEAHIDYIADDFGGTLSIKAPYLKQLQVATSSTLAEQITTVLEEEINVQLKAHGGRVSLVEITEENIVILQFGGGCHGCGMVNMTLKNGIEKTLRERFPIIKQIVDVTDHASGKNPYYKGNIVCEN